MATVKKEYVFDLMREQECPFWRVTDNSGVKMRVGENDTEANIEEAITQLEACFDNIEDNVICVMISNKTRKQKSGAGRGYLQFEYKVNLGQGVSSGAGMGGGNMFTMLMAQMSENNRLQNKLTEEKYLNLLEKLQDEKKDSGSNFDKLIPFLNKLMDDKPNKVAIAGEDDDVDENIEAKKKKTLAAIKRLAKIDPKLPENLTMLADFAEKNSEDYFDALSALKLKMKFR